MSLPSYRCSTSQWKDWRKSGKVFLVVKAGFEPAIFYWKYKCLTIKLFYEVTFIHYYQSNKLRREYLKQFFCVCDCLRDNCLTAWLIQLELNIGFEPMFYEVSVYIATSLIRLSRESCESVFHFNATITPLKVIYPKTGFEPIPILSKK